MGIMMKNAKRSPKNVNFVTKKYLFMIKRSIILNVAVGLRNVQLAEIM